MVEDLHGSGVLGFRSFVDVSRVKNTQRFHVDLLPFIRPGGKTVGMHESVFCFLQDGVEVT
jgi:hypothetical protein